MIDQLEKNPDDKLRILGDAGITVVGAGLGLAAAGTLASAAGATSLLSLFGYSLVAATPVGWLVGSALAAGAVAYGVSRVIHDGGMAEGRRKELLIKYREEKNSMEAKERAGDISESDKTRFIIATREIVDKNIISPEDASELIKHVQQGDIPVSQAFLMIETLLGEQLPVEVGGLENGINKALSKDEIKQVKSLENAFNKGYLSEVDFNKEIKKIAEGRS